MQLFFLNEEKNISFVNRFFFTSNCSVLPLVAIMDLIIVRLSFIGLEGICVCPLSRRLTSLCFQWSARNIFTPFFYRRPTRHTSIITPGCAAFSQSFTGNGQSLTDCIFMGFLLGSVY